MLFVAKALGVLVAAFWHYTTQDVTLIEIAKFSLALPMIVPTRGGGYGARTCSVVRIILDIVIVALLGFF